MENQDKDPNGLDAHSPGAKLDDGKLDFTLVPVELEMAVARVMAYGAKKYTRDGWKSVSDPGRRYFAALERHLKAYKGGELLDAESLIHHLHHAACNIAFLLWFKANTLDSEEWRNRQLPKLSLPAVPKRVDVKRPDPKIATAKIAAFLEQSRDRMVGFTPTPSEIGAAEVVDLTEVHAAEIKRDAGLVAAKKAQEDSRSRGLCDREGPVDRRVRNHARTATEPLRRNTNPTGRREGDYERERERDDRKRRHGPVDRRVTNAKADDQRSRRRLSPGRRYNDVPYRREPYTAASPKPLTAETLIPRGEGSRPSDFLRRAPLWHGPECQTCGGLRASSSENAGNPVPPRPAGYTHDRTED